ncbi:MAP/microtubule affinity-regulating kinase 3-like [Venturia canescens]|uniref:MAP/microtubule affinity-regulating kinase 3-like n=1 Tax=Venturia canescens TaxID=32260 RepID=UPI001C9D6490|nr:MAP/microtubule affinity-regulating kinase 3-like [Venturia canescens]
MRRNGWGKTDVLDDPNYIPFEVRPVLQKSGFHCRGAFDRLIFRSRNVTCLDFRSGKVAIKIIDTNTVREPYVIKNLTREAKLLAKLQHPSIVYLYETIRCNSSYYLVTELATGGDLYTHIRKQPTGHLDESTAKSYARQLVSALNHIHLKGIVHRDLKMENIMLKDARKKHIKIIDFGLSNWSTGANHLETHCGSPEYAAPELFLEGQKYGPEVDLWSLGVILYGMVTGELPFLSPRTEKTSAEEWRRKLMTQIFRGLTTLQEKKISSVSMDYKNLVRGLLEPVAHRRIPMVDIFRHPWLYDRNKNSFDVAFHTKDNFKSDVLRSIFREINAASGLTDANINEKIRLKPYGQIGGMFNIKAHKLLGTGSIDVFEAPSSSPLSIGQKIRTVGRLLSRESSSRISSTGGTSIPNNSSVSNENRSQSPTSRTAKRSEKSSAGRSFSNCYSVASSTSATRTLSHRRRSESEKTDGDAEARGAAAKKSTSNTVSISTRPMTQPLILESPAPQLSSSLTKPTNYSRYRPSCPGPSILSRDQSYARLRRSLENKDKIYQQRYSTPDVSTCTKPTEKHASASRIHKIGRVVMPMVSKNWQNSRLLSSAGKIGSRNLQKNDIFSSSTTEKYEKYHESAWSNSRLLTRGKTFLWNKNTKNLAEAATKNSVKN